MTLPDSDLLYLREDEIPPGYNELDAGTERLHIRSDIHHLVLRRLIDARKEIHRLQIAAGEVVEQRAGDEPV